MASPKFRCDRDTLVLRDAHKVMEIVSRESGVGSGELHTTLAVTGRAVCCG